MGCGFGFDQLKETINVKEGLRTNNNFCPLDSVPYTNSKPTWLRPELVAELKFSGRTQDNMTRAPIFLRFSEMTRSQSTVVSIIRHPNLINMLVSIEQSHHNRNHIKINFRILTKSTGLILHEDYQKSNN